MKSVQEIQDYIKEHSGEHKAHYGDVKLAQQTAIKELLPEPGIDNGVKKMFNSTFKTAFKKLCSKKIVDPTGQTNYVIGQRGIGQNSNYGYGTKRASYFNDKAWDQLNQAHVDMVPNKGKKELMQLFLQFRNAAKKRLGDCPEVIVFDKPIQMNRVKRENVNGESFYTYQKRDKDIAEKVELKYSDSGVHLTLTTDSTKKHNYYYNDDIKAYISLVDRQYGLNVDLSRNGFTNWIDIVSEERVLNYVSGWQDNMKDIITAWHYVHEKAMGQVFLNTI